MIKAKNSVPCIIPFGNSARNAVIVMRELMMVLQPCRDGSINPTRHLQHHYQILALRQLLLLKSKEVKRFHVKKWNINIKFYWLIAYIVEKVIISK